VDLAAGQEIDGRYIVEGVLGEGGMAVVYRVRHTRLQSEHALKLLTVSSASIRKRLEQEGQVQATLRHPNIVAVTDLVSVNGQPGLVMEMVRGQSLAEFLQNHEPSQAQLDELVTGMLRGVAAAHDQDLIHRDLKPANILLAVTSHGLIPKVADFGLAKALMSADNSQTRSGATMGTPAYMAPEQIRNAKYVDHRADVFSLGAILYEMVTRTRAFPGDDMMDVFTNITRGIYAPLPDDTPLRVRRAVEMAMEPDIEKRVQTCRQLLDLWRGVGVADSELSLGDPITGEAVWSEEVLHSASAASGAPSMPWNSQGGNSGLVAVSATMDVNAVGGRAAAGTDVSEATFMPEPLSIAMNDSLAGAPPVPVPTMQAPTPAPTSRRWLLLGFVVVLLGLGVAYLVSQLGGSPPSSSIVTPTPVVAPPAKPFEPAKSDPPSDALVESVSPPKPAAAVVPEPHSVAVAPNPPNVAPQVAPSTATLEVPVPEPMPDSVEVLPEPSPVPAPVAPITTNVAITGDAKRVYLVGADGSRTLLPAEIMPGHYTVEMVVGTQSKRVHEIEVALGIPMSLKCVESARRCVVR
jgi:serine/threonine protein kinase